MRLLFDTMAAGYENTDQLPIIALVLYMQTKHFQTVNSSSATPEAPESALQYQAPRY